MHIQGVGFHFIDEKFGSDIGKTLFISLVRKEEKRHTGKNQQEAYGKKQLFRGKRRMLSQRITLKWNIAILYEGHGHYSTIIKVPGFVSVSVRQQLIIQTYFVDFTL